MNIYKRFNILFARGGTCQTERLLPELLDNAFLISDKQFSDYLRFLYLYTDLLAYYDTNNKLMDGNVWRKFLEQDETVIRSLILHTDMDKVKKNVHKDFLALRRDCKSLTEGSYMANILTTAQELIILLDYWHKNLTSEDPIRVKLDAITCEELNHHINRIYKALQQSYSAYSTSFVDFCTFLGQLCNGSSLWSLENYPIYNEISEKSSSDEQIIDIIEDFFDTAIHTIYQLKELAASDYFDTFEKRNKEPHMALLIAFLQLLQYAEQSLNYIPQRSLDHYYRHILKFNNNPSIPDKAYIHFKLSPQCPFAFIPEGIRLVAKNPVNGEEILFETKRNITINAGKISQINVSSNVEKTDKKKNKTIELVTASYQEESLASLSFPLVPAVEKNNKVATIKPSCQGLAMVVGSPLFYLAEGMRTIYIKWKLTCESFEKLIHTNPDQEKITTDAFLDRIATELHTMSHIQITTKDGWFSLPPEVVEVAFMPENYGLHMILCLNAEVPSMTKLPINHQGSYVNPGVPAVSIDIGRKWSSTGLYLLNVLEVEKVDLKVKVQQYRSLVLQNQLGIIDNSQIFEPFGPLAKPDSSFYIGSGEIFSKNLTALKIDIQWDGIPLLEGGLKTYYDAYPTKVRNEDFKVNISYLNHQHWNPFHAKKRQCIPLFQVIKDNKGTERLDPSRTIGDIDIAILGITKSNEPLDVFVYGPNTIAGFLKLKLNIPEQAFGHAIYPTLMSNVLVHNVQKKREEDKIVLNEPYTPLIKSITADYEAEETMTLVTLPGEEEKKYLNGFFHVFPFGFSRIFPSKLASPSILFPLIQRPESFIAFGIKELNSSNFSLHIAIKENSLSCDKESSPPEWFYLFDNTWLPLKEAIIVDKTNGCTRSGIIFFDLGRLSIKPSTGNSCMATDLVWIKVQFYTETYSLPIIIGAYLQAVTVFRVMDKNGVFSSPVLPPHTIEQLQYPIEGVECVVQPFKTFGGRQFENHQAFYRRVSERLRHKNRAISVWDYERLVLENFPEIFRVKCINHTLKSAFNMAKPGYITLVVIAKIEQGDLHKPPLVSRKFLTEIKEYIQNISTPFIKFEVINPVYEDVKVNATVKFKMGYEKGLFLNLLQEELRNFISPWLLDASADIPLGKEITTSKILDFINSRYYIEGIGNFSILKYMGKTPNLTLNKITSYDSTLCASYPWSVMASAQNHKITAVDKFDKEIRLRHGSIEGMAIGEDFIIGPLEASAACTPEPYSEEDIPIPSLTEYCLITQKNIKTDYGNY